MKKSISDVKKSKIKRNILSGSIGLLFGIASLILGFSMQDHWYGTLFLGLGVGISSRSFSYLMFSISMKKTEKKVFILIGLICLLLGAAIFIFGYFSPKITSPFTAEILCAMGVCIFCLGFGYLMPNPPFNFGNKKEFN